MRRGKALTLVADNAARIGDPDLSDLPPELLSELSASHGDVLERQILSAIEALGGSADLDRLLIALYRRFSVVQKRRFLQNKLWRMVRKGLVQKTKSDRGVFRLERRRRK
ncbi:MAG TPA: hypothetical protein VG889_16580 [Rhizomicrobium sp.]|nr:hypothetical protein [Rhizomicrobium sp.]